METIEKLQIAADENIAQQKNPIVQHKSEIIRLKLKVLAQINRLTIKKTGKPISGLKLVYQIRKKYQAIFGEPLLSKVAKVDNRYFWRLAASGFPSQASVKMHENEINRLIPNGTRTGLRSLLFAITKKCSLNCEHCFEWDNLNKKQDLPVAEIIKIIHKYQDYGTTQMMLSGGEPMLRVNDIYKILAAAKPGTDFWIITSGLGLNTARAQQLKASGLTGVMVSLDHFEAAKHNEFRGFETAFDWASQAVANANEAGLVTTLSLCATKTFTTEENLRAYMILAKKWGVSFVQLIEPRATGRYLGKDVLLEKNELDLLEKTYLEYNSSPQFKEFPIINYLGYHQRKVGCFGGGDRFFYIDTDGDAHLCPFCENKVGKAGRFSAEEMISLLGDYACHDYSQSAL
ncbi:MAG: MoaA/NifB/PqqE/SkfB family radical SAM enzyme [Roseivirga sp.]|jgi:MoaA/NifB/PqqE/SkfB family radical SAM enzyme